MRLVIYIYLFFTIIYTSINTEANAKSMTNLSKLPLADLQNHLDETEKNYSDIVAGTEKKVTWHSKEKQTDIAIIYLHGFSASRQEISPISERLAESLSANLFMTRLSGHGRSMNTLSTVKYQDWQRDALEAYQIGKLIGKQIIIISTSTGGTLATWLLNEVDNEDVLANVMLTPNFQLKRKSTLILKYPFGLSLAKLINGPYHSFPVKNKLAAQFWTERYKLEALIPLLNLMSEVQRIDKAKITTPQIVLYSSNDRVVDSDATVKTMQLYKNAHTQVIKFNQTEDQSHHILAGDLISPSSTQAVLDIITQAINKILGN